MYNINKKSTGVHLLGPMPVIHTSRNTKNASTANAGVYRDHLSKLVTSIENGSFLHAVAATSQGNLDAEYYRFGFQFYKRIKQGTFLVVSL